MDPHTATCLKAVGAIDENSSLKNVLCSTAEWTKFAPTMMQAITKDSARKSDKEALSFISKELNISIIATVQSIFEKKIYHDSIIHKDAIEKTILDFIS